MNIPFFIVGDTWIEDGATVTIEDGVTVNFAYDYTDLYVGYGTDVGTLIANDVEFIGLDNDDSRIEVYTNNTQGAYSSANLTNCSFNNVYIECGSNGSLAISGSIIKNVQDGLILDSDKSITIDYNDFINIIGYGIENENTTTIDAENNFWGHESGPYHPTLNPNGQGCEVSDNVDFEPWSTEPNNFTPEAPTIITQPQDVTVNIGESATFDVVAEGTFPLIYQWKKGGTNINGATNSSYTINNVSMNDEGSYSCLVSNTYGQILSDEATLTVNNNQLLTADIILPFAEEHMELNDNEISPGEIIGVKVTITNNTQNNFYLTDCFGVSSNENILFNELSLNIISPVLIAPQQTITLSQNVKFQIINWPNISSFPAGLKVLGYFQGNQEEEYYINNIQSFNVFIPSVNNHYQINELQEAIDEGNIEWGDYVVIDYMPFFGINNCHGCAGLKAGSLVTGLFTNVVSSTYESIATDIIKDQALEYVVSLPFLEELKYSKVYLIAGINNFSGTDPFDNFFITNDPNDYWEIPKLGYPVKAITKLKKLQDYVSANNPFEDPVDLPILEPLVFICDTLEDDGYGYLTDYFWNPQDEDVVQHGIVHQYWHDQTGSVPGYYFSIITVNEAPSGLPIIGDLINTIYNRHISRYLCRVDNENEIPELGSAIKIKGTYKKSGGFWDILHVPSNWTGGKPQRWYIDAEEITYWSGQNADLEKWEQEFFNTDRRKGGISFDLTKIFGKNFNNNQAFLHLFDMEGNHTGPIFNESNELIDYEMEIPGSFYTQSSEENQFIYVDTLTANNFVYYIKSKDDNITVNLDLSIPDLIDSIPIGYNLVENITLNNNEILQSGINILPSQDSSNMNMGVSCKVMPQTLFWNIDWENDPNKTIEVYIGNLSNNLDVNDINVATILFQGEIQIVQGSNQIIEDFVGFEGSVLKIEIEADEILQLLSGVEGTDEFINVEFLTNSTLEIESGYVITLTSSSSINENINISPLISIRPNPTTDGFRIYADIFKDGSFDLKIYNVTGQIVRKETISLENGVTTKSISVTDIKPGLYTISIGNGNLFGTGKLIIN